MKLFVTAMIIVLFALPGVIDAKGGKPRPTCDWETYYECIAAGGDRLFCLSRCMQ